MDGFGAGFAAHELDGPVGDDLVGVHVAGGAAAGLEDIDGEMAVKGARRHLAGRQDDGLGNCRRQQPQVAIDSGRRQLDLPQGADHLTAQPLAADPEILHRPGGLGPVQGVVGNLHLSHGVSFIRMFTLIDSIF